MCIRDRLPRDDLRRRTAGQLQPHHALARSGGREMLRRYRDCLLYTSDAADERSSVDLGGRRIIKKKNN